MPTMTQEALLSEWTAEGWASYTLPLGPGGLTWTPPPKRPLADPVREAYLSSSGAYYQRACDLSLGATPHRPSTLPPQPEP